MTKEEEHQSMLNWLSWVLGRANKDLDLVFDEIAYGKWCAEQVYIAQDFDREKWIRVIVNRVRGHLRRIKEELIDKKYR